MGGGSDSYRVSFWVNVLKLNGGDCLKTVNILKTIALFPLNALIV